MLRRLLRRTVRSARLLGVMDPVMPGLTQTVSELMSPSYPELATDFERIQRVAVKEEQAFLRTIASGSKLFDVAAIETKEAGSSVVAGSTAFLLHDTQGFPIDLTLEMAAEAGLSVDTEEFRRLMEEQRQRARADAKARKGKLADLSVYRPLLEAGRTEFTGYSELESEATVRGLIRDGERVTAASVGDEIELVLDRTPLYAESGGQDSDAGVILGNGASAEVLDVQKVDKRLIVHRVRITDGEFTEGAPVLAKVDPEWRWCAAGALCRHVADAAPRQGAGSRAPHIWSQQQTGTTASWTLAWNQGAVLCRICSELEDVTNSAVRQDLLGAGAARARRRRRRRWARSPGPARPDDETVRTDETAARGRPSCAANRHVQHSSEIGSWRSTRNRPSESDPRRIEAVVGIEAFDRLRPNRDSCLPVGEADEGGAAELLVGIVGYCWSGCGGGGEGTVHAPGPLDCRRRRRPWSTAYSMLAGGAAVRREPRRGGQALVRIWSPAT